MREVYLKFVRFFFALLFLYAALSKWTSFDVFQLQLAQSPILSTYAKEVSYGILIIEILVAGLLCFYNTMRIGLYCSYFLMVAFTVYIYLILHHSDFVPCSCGGILEKMTWNQHMLFNIICCLILVVALIVLLLKQASNTSNSTASKGCARGLVFLTTNTYLLKKLVVVILPLTLMGILSVVFLFVTSEHSVKKTNDFTRRYYPHGVFEKQQLTLQANSFYFAGLHKGQLYLAHPTAPLRLVEVDTLLKESTTHVLTIDRMDLKYTNIKTTIAGDHYFLGDGVTGIVFKQKIGQWDAKTFSYGQVYFTNYVPIDSTKIIFRGVSTKTKSNVLGSLTPKKDPAVVLNDSLLVKQIDGIFDTDGSLSYSPYYDQIIYMYYRSNGYLVADSNLNLIKRATSIDTTSVAQLTVQKLTSGETKLSVPSYTVNGRVVVHRNLLFNIANTIGKNDSKDILKQADIVDVYDFDQTKYVGSFLIYHVQDQKLTDLLVTDTHVYGIFGNQLVRYELSINIAKHYR